MLYYTSTRTVLVPVRRLCRYLQYRYRYVWIADPLAGERESSSVGLFRGRCVRVLLEFHQRFLKFRSRRTDGVIGRRIDERIIIIF